MDGWIRMHAYHQVSTRLFYEDLFKMIVLLYMENNPFITLTPIYFSVSRNKKTTLTCGLYNHLYKELNESTEEGSESYPILTSKQNYEPENMEDSLPAVCWV